MIKNVYNDVLGMTVEEAEHSGLSFEDIKIASLKNLAKIVSKRQLTGASKFYS